MSQLFISHSSRNKFQALALRDWLSQEGWDDLFLDLDPERGIVAGERWERALHQAASRCDAVLFLVSNPWLASTWCLREFELAQRLNKRMFGVLVEDLPVQSLPDKLTDTWQLVNLASGSDHSVLRALHPDTGEERHVNFSASGLKRLRAGLVRAGLDPRFFDWPPAHDPDRAPYRGMRAVEAEDAGIFFGREAPIIELMAELRGLREAPSQRLMVILGASGAGKSSFLRAGLLPRLAREDRHFVVLPVLRPGHDVLEGEAGMVRALTQACSDAGLGVNRASLRELILEDKPDQPEALAQTLIRLSRQCCAPVLPGQSDGRDPTLVLAIDQAEELFLAEGNNASARFLTLVQALITDQRIPLMVLLTLRSDRYEQLQTAGVLALTRPRLFSLTPMPQGNYRAVIEGPVQRLNASNRKLALEPALTERLLEDIQCGGGKDALPLLAFTLERLFQDYGADGDLRLVEYQAMHGINGAIDAAVQQALAAAARDPRLSGGEPLFTLLRRGLIPWLAGIDPDTLAPRRRIARSAEIPREALPIIEHLIGQRLLITDVNNEGETTIEPAHEALLRQWSLLKSWLEEDSAVLVVIEGVRRATRDWLANERLDEWLNHSAGRLDDAQSTASRNDLRGYLTADDHAYLQQCRAAYTAKTQEELDRARELAAAQTRATAHQRLVAQRTRMGLVVASALLLIASVLGILFAMYWQEANARKNQALVAQSQYLADIANERIEAGEPETAALIAMEALPDPQDEDSRPLVRKAVDMLYRSVRSQRLRRIISGYNASVTSVDISADGRFAVAASVDGTVREWNLQDPDSPWVYSGHLSAIHHVEYAPDGQHFVTASKDKTARVWVRGDSVPVATLSGHADEVLHATVSPDGLQVATSSKDGSVRLWALESGARIDALAFGDSPVRYSAFTHDGTRVFSLLRYGNVRVWDPRRLGPADRLPTDIAKEKLARYLGVVHETTHAAGADSQDGVKILEVLPMGAARQARLRPGDLLRRINSRQVNPENLGALLDVHKTGETLDFGILRDGAEQTLQVTLGWKRSDLGQELSSDNGDAQDIALSPDGKMLASLHGGKAVVLWDIGTLKPRLTLSGFNADARVLAFNSEGSWLLTGHDDGAIQIWGTASGLRMQVLKGHTGSISDIEIDAAANLIVSAAQNGEIGIHDHDQTEPLQMLKGHAGGTQDIAVDRLQGSLVSGGHDQTARQWRLSHDVLAEIDHAGFPVVDHAVDVQGNRVAVVFADGTVKINSVETGEELRAFQTDMPLVMDVKLARQDHALVIMCGANGLIEFWNWKDAKKNGTYSTGGSSVAACALAPEESSLIAGLLTGEVVAVDVKTFKEKYRTDAEAAGIDHLVHSDHLMHFAVASGDGRVSVYGTISGEAVARLPVQADRVVDLAFHPKQAMLSLSDAGGGLRLWRYLQAGHGIRLDTAGSIIHNLAFDPGGRMLVASTGRAEIMIWEVDSGNSVQQFVTPYGKVSGLSVNFDGSSIYTAGDTGEITIWSTLDGTGLARFFGIGRSIGEVTLTSNGERMVAEIDNRKISIWPDYSGLDAMRTRATVLMPREPLSQDERTKYHLGER